MNNKITSFTEWMKENNMSISSLASELDVPYHRVYKVVERQHVPESFKWRFAKRYGVEEARKAFAEANPSTDPTAILEPA